MRKAYETGQDVEWDVEYYWHVLGGFAVWRPRSCVTRKGIVLGPTTLWNGTIDADNRFHPTLHFEVLVVENQEGRQAYVPWNYARNLDT